MELRSLRDRESREVEYFASRTPIPVFYQVHLGRNHSLSKIAGKPVHRIPFLKWVKELELP